MQRSNDSRVIYVLGCFLPLQYDPKTKMWKLPFSTVIEVCSEAYVKFSVFPLTLIWIREIELAQFNSFAKDVQHGRSALLKYGVVENGDHN